MRASVAKVSNNVLFFIFLVKIVSLTRTRKLIAGIYFHFREI
jgi:hypothetical protein